MRKADNLPPSCAVVMKSGNLNFLEPSGPLQACNGTDLPLPFYYTVVLNEIYVLSSPVTGQERPRGFQEVKVPRFRDNGTRWW